ncbi:OpgC domain-containing protein [Pseudooceanicola sediminis]|uniref:OpgC domain-containing protein n=1 Tax=Pseudooceanicola sediminis TaxID=2211117 RepID=A0A399J408_9RHOB|nr:OpgC domain-containing protein [Puniceibacterium sp. HSS470]RII40084.1 OpgC domain-containing protein [Pseudooceanicola sediminis]
MSPRDNGPPVVGQAFDFPSHSGAPRVPDRHLAGARPERSAARTGGSGNGGSDGGAALPPAAGGKRPRDLRIDTFRGLALVMIFVDHVPGNPFEALTSRNYGFSDAAEGFFVMSGIAAGIAYSGRFAPEILRRDGAWAAISPVWKRAWTLYLVQVFLTMWAIAIYAWGANTFGLPKLLSEINLRQVFENTPEALIGIPALTHQLGYVNILPAYSVLLLGAPLVLFCGLRAPRTTLAVSLVLWFGAGLFRLNLPNFPNPGGWFFNPVAWQLIFVIGLLTGMHLRKGQRFVPRSRLLFGLAAGYLILVVAWMFIPALANALNTQLARLGAAGVPFFIVAHDKTFLSLPRLLHVLALVYVLSSLPVVKSLCASPLAAPLRLMGRHGLVVFSVGTVVSLLFQVFLAAEPDSRVLSVVLPLAGLLLQVLVAWGAEIARRPRPRTVQGGLARDLTAARSTAKVTIPSVPV